MVRANGNGLGGGEVAAAGVPTMGKDPYSAEVLIAPYPLHQELREAGPVVWLEVYDIGAAGRVEPAGSPPVARREPAGEPRRPLGDSTQSFESLPVAFRFRSSLAWRVKNAHNRGGTGKRCAHR